MTWFTIPKDYTQGRCATEGCYGVAEWRLEAGGVGSEYCGNCKAWIDAVEEEEWQREAWLRDQEAHERAMLEREEEERRFARYPHG